MKTPGLASGPSRRAFLRRLWTWTSRATALAGTALGVVMLRGARRPLQEHFVPDHVVEQARSTGGVAVDGLWIEAGALPDHFREGELKSIAIKAFSRLLSIHLPEA